MKKPWFIKRWEEGHRFDFWTINHILGGGVLACLCFYMNWSFSVSFLISFLIMLAWDLLEVVLDIKETINNKVWDLITGVSGFYAAYVLMENTTHHLSFFLLIFIPFLILEIWGYLAYKKILP